MREVVVEQYQIHVRALQLAPQALLLAVALSSEQDARLRIDHRAQTRSHGGMVIDYQHPDHLAPSRLSSGTSSSTRVPDPAGRGPITSRPPTVAARLSIASSPLAP